MSVVAIWNPQSGSAPEEHELREAFGPDVELVETTPDDPGEGQSRQAVERGTATVVACGGDGTVRACLEPLLGTETALAIVPLGTGNLLAANLDLPAGLDAAADVAVRPVRTIDVGRANGEAFAVMAGSGFDAAMIGGADDDQKGRFGVLAYVLAGARHVRDALVPTTVEVDGRPWYRGRTSMVLVGNMGSMMNGIEVHPDAEPDDGLLDVAVLSARSMRDWASVLVRLVTGRPHRRDLVSRAQGRTVTIRTDRAREYEIDGEVRDPTTEVRIVVEPASLKVHHGGER